MHLELWQELFWFRKFFNEMQFYAYAVVGEAVGRSSRHRRVHLLSATPRMYRVKGRWNIYIPKEPGPYGYFFVEVHMLGRELAHRLGDGNFCGEKVKRIKNAFP